MGADRLVEYWFQQDSHLDQALLEALSRARLRGLEAHLATVQEHHRAAYLWETLGLRGHFSAMHYAADLGWRKSDAEFYRAIERRTGYSPPELLLVDDDPANVARARACGWHAVTWTGEARLDEVLEAYWRAGPA